jgi:hypothetical protein
MPKARTEPLTLVIAAVLAIALYGGSVAAAEKSAEPIRCSIVNLLATPLKYDGKLVQIVGYAQIQFEGDSIYLSESDAAHDILQNGLWLKFSGSTVDRKILGKSGRGYALVVGVFDARETGHMGLWPGGIVQITRFEPWTEIKLDIGSPN